MSAPTRADAGGEADDAVALGERFAVLSRHRLPALDQPTAEAYSACDAPSGEADYFALVCDPKLPARSDIMAGFAKMNRVPLLTLMEWGVVDWPLARARRQIVILRQPAGERLVAPGSEALPAMRESQLRQLLLTPLVPILKAMAERSLTHCAIRPDNLFYGDPERRALILGEAVSAPPGYSQPAVFETIERAMASPSGRGPGAPSDDLYALGVSAALLLLGRDPCAGLSAPEIVARKIERGSYGALLGTERLSLQLMELLRGLLCDEPRERWGHNDLETWLSGRHMSPKQPILQPKAQRSFHLGGQAYWTARAVAHAMANEWDAGIAAVESGQLVDWVRRSLGDDKKADAITAAMSNAKSAMTSPALARDHMLAETLIVLDRQAPLRLRNLAANVDSLGQALAIEFTDSALRDSFAAAINGRLPQLWFAAQPKIPPELAPIQRAFEQAHGMLAHWGGEIGLVRCLYAFNSDWPCRSPLLESHCAMTAGELVTALERRAVAGAGEGRPMDLHIAVFCAARLRRPPRRLLDALLRPSEPAVECTAMLGVFAQAQRESAVGPLPGLAAWLARFLAPAIENFHNRPHRAWVSDAAARLAAAGDLEQLAQLIDNPIYRREDQGGFDWARAQYQQASQEIAWLEAGGLTSRQHVVQGSHQVATVVSAMLSGLGLILLSLFYVA